MEPIMWGFFFVYLAFEHPDFPDGTPNWQNTGNIIVDTPEQCEATRLEGIRDVDGNIIGVVSEQCYAARWQATPTGQLRLVMAMPDVLPPAPLTVNRDCAYQAAGRLVDPALPTTGLTGAAKKAQQRLRVATRKDAISNIHAGNMGSQDFWDTLCPPAPAS